MQNETYTLGRRIAIRGVTGSGKSTLGRALARALELPVIELDAINWQRPDWQMLPEDEFRAYVEAAIEAAPDGWVCEGNYSSVSDVVLSKIDTLIWIHLPWRVSFYRMVKRTLTRAARREVLWGVQRESLRANFFSKDSLILWGIHHHRASVRRTQGLMNDMTHVQRIELRSAKEVTALLESVRVARTR